MIVNMEEKNEKEDEIYEVDDWIKYENTDKIPENKQDSYYSWKILLFIGLAPYIGLLLSAIKAWFEGTYFIESYMYGLDAFMLVIIGNFIVSWVIYIPAAILVILSIYKICKI